MLSPFPSLCLFTKSQVLPENTHIPLFPLISQLWLTPVSLSITPIYFSLALFTPQQKHSAGLVHHGLGSKSSHVTLLLQTLPHPPAWAWLASSPPLTRVVDPGHRKVIGLFGEKLTWQQRDGPNRYQLESPANCVIL